DQWNERNVNRQDILGRHGNGQQQADDHEPDAGGSASFILPAHHGQGLVGQGMGQPRFANGDGKRAQGGIGQGNGGTAAQAGIEGIDGIFKGHARHKATGNGADDQGNNNVNAAQAQYEHDQYRGNYGIHGKLRIGIEGIPAPFGRWQHEKCANVQEMAAAVKMVV